jgi:hypothetical protein
VEALGIADAVRTQQTEVVENSKRDCAWVVLVPPPVIVTLAFDDT